MSSQNLQLSQGEQQLANQLASLKEELTALERERDDLFSERDELMNTQTVQGGMLSSLQIELRYWTCQLEETQTRSLGLPGIVFLGSFMPVWQLVLAELLIVRKI